MSPIPRILHGNWYANDSVDEPGLNHQWHHPFWQIIPLLDLGYLAVENRILKAQITTRLLLTDGEKATLAEIAHRLGRKALEEVANVMKPDTIMDWYRKRLCRKVGGLSVPIYTRFSRIPVTG